ncbi:TolC family protein [Thermomonas hydrothermalis]|uniref:Outer membrane protein, cobalt-zinc-cadmium efflux system n=1 Tax=Thermomonas hydrothermalis TaxID=213588 RepID=A0A1M4YVD7_9GAMM|nr:outer membrane protein, cobalt-zinc-cadmium efflux system [Thermomonas hydrothermalis]
MRSSRFAATAACVAAMLFCLSAAAADRLTLDDAFRRVEQTHPELRLFGGRRDVLTTELERAAFKPPLVVGIEAQNVLGTGEASGLQGADITLSLASVLERGGKLDARRALAQSRIDVLAVEREARRLDLLAEVARRYLAVVAAEKRAEIARLDIAQRKRAVAGARQRLQAGASPESVVLAAEAALARAELDQARAVQQARAARQHLATLWGERAPSFDVVPIDPLALPKIASFDELASWLAKTPELARFAGEQRIREARLQLARTAATPDLNWQVGVRRLQATDDFGLVGSVSMPLGTNVRAQPEIRAAEAELALLGLEREVKSLSLYSTLAEAHGRFLTAQLEVRRLGSDVIPRLSRAEAAAERAYRAGAASYLEWAQLQAERTAALRGQLEAALEAHSALLEIQRLTGQPFVSAGPSIEQGDTP